jgi:hypothetical protein
MLAKKPPKPFMVDRLTAALLEFGQNAPIPVIWVVSNDRSYVLHQSLVVFAGALMIAPVVVRALRQTDGLKAPVQSTLILMLIHQVDFFRGGQLSPKKFFSKAISTSF